MTREKQVIENFSQIASGILSRYSNDIIASTAAKGARPTFEELMGDLKKMEKELTGKAVRLIDAYKKEIGDVPDELSAALKQAIASTIQQFVKSL